jgi:hypothetical protein
MRVQRKHLSVLFNRLYDRGDERFTISHPADEIGDLVRITLGEYDGCTVEFITDNEEYATARQDVGRNYPEKVYEDLPDANDYIEAIVASGIIPIANREEVAKFLQRYGNPDLMAGHKPVVAGFDTNLMPWRIGRLLGLREPDEGLGYVNGFVLATGVRDELDWEYKCHDTDPFVKAFGDAYEEYWNQSLGAARIGRLGLQTYREIRDIQQAEEIICEEDDDQIVSAYEQFDQQRRNQVMLFSNDRNFIESAQAHRLLGQRIEFPSELPRKTTATWRELELLVYFFAIAFGIIEVPSVTIHGIWRGKDALDWQNERIKLDCRSPKLQPKLEGDLSIVESYEELVG